MTFKCKLCFLEEEKRKVDKGCKINEQSGVQLPKRDCVCRASDLIIFGSLPVIACFRKAKWEKCHCKKFFLEM